ncbi:MAG: hypothetical protein FJ291_10195 [Planctomycetes bacterium]|nr:hypothetical protein [Planctomycetota bacterium]
MKVCAKCKSVFAGDEPDPRFPFPAFGMLGAALGVAGAIATGTIILAPAGLVAGLLADAREQCESCGEPIEDGEEAFAMLEARQESGGEALFTPVRSPRGAADQRSLAGRPDAGWGQPASVGRTGPSGTPPVQATHRVPAGEPCQAEETSYRYDPGERLLVPLQPQGPASDGTPLYDWSIGPEFGDVVLDEFGQAGVPGVGQGMPLPADGHGAQQGDKGPFDLTPGFGGTEE